VTNPKLPRDYLIRSRKQLKAIAGEILATAGPGIT
jgi:hypothetical protein